jgi:DNA-binding transcriptional ArsR family regulator
VEAFAAMAQPTRREILRLLGGRELTVGGVAAHFPVSQPAISQHLKVLRESGLVTERREGTRRLYRVRPEGFSDVNGFLAEVVPAGLERLKHAAEEDERRGRGYAARRN